MHDNQSSSHATVGIDANEPEPTRPSVERASVAWRADSLAAGSQLLHHDRLTVALCERGTVLTAPRGVAPLVFPIFGGARVMTAEWSVQLGKGDILAGDTQTHHDVVVSPRGACIVIAGTPAAWSSVSSKAVGARSGAVLFPALHRCVPALRRSLLRLLRPCLGDMQIVGSNHFAHQLMSVVNDLQAVFTPMIERCPGSCSTRKRAVFLRLQRVRNYITACANQDLDVAKLALMANYSVSHFITTFRSVFEETPYSNLSRYRLESASTLLSGSNLGIADIAHAIGFQSRSSFTRAIKKHLGSSATRFREELAEAAQSEAGTGSSDRLVCQVRKPGHLPGHPDAREAE